MTNWFNHRAIPLPEQIQPRGFEYFQLEEVYADALLIRLGYEEGGKDDLFTLYLTDSAENNADKSSYLGPPTRSRQSAKGTTSTRSCTR